LEYQQIIHIPGNLLNKICLEPQYLLFAHAYTERKRPTTRTYALHKKKEQIKEKNTNLISGTKTKFTKKWKQEQKESCQKSTGTTTNWLCYFSRLRASACA